MIRLFDFHVSVYTVFVKNKIGFIIGWVVSFVLVSVLFNEVLTFLLFPHMSLVLFSITCVIFLPIMIYHMYYIFEILNAFAGIIGWCLWDPEEKLKKMSRGDAV